ncbi:Synerg-CTERM sorting domain-containing protein [uncultured Fretibacterium sp.]|uniref:Synerg-CTERM sorting domain-containing protein n=1 Tax=uncultured Fretibacterium sp. TaxID=1678694 RepID=UPI00262448FA|nr:Synerg-CTERM sorting domain-containing protein [uncultured Fretibacterium sp.]
MRKVWVLLAVFLLAASAPGAALAADVPINSTNFPDNTFIIFVREHDTNKDGFLSLAEIEAAKSMTVKPDFGAKNLVGIEYFTYLETLVCAKQELTSLDMRWNAKLKDLHCETNDLLTALNVRENTELTSLHCENTPLTELDVSKNTKLTWLSCYENRLTTLDLSKNTALTDLACASNDLTTVDVSGNTNLRNLDCSNNDLKALDVSQNTELQKLECKNDRLTTLDLSKNTKLMYLYCEQNQLTSLDVSKNTRLSTLECPNNRLTALDLSKNTELSTLKCTDNRLTALDLSKNTELSSLYCEGNQLTALNVANTRLDSLSCQGNRLTFLDLQGLPLNSNATVGGQTRDGLTVSAIGGVYVVDLGAFLSPDRFFKVKDLAGKDSGGAPLTPLSFLNNGKVTFKTKPVTVTYRYATGNTEAPLMDVTLIESNTITVSVSGRGRVTRQGSTEALSGSVAVFPGDDATFVILADAGYEIADLRADNAPVSVPSRTARYEYTFRNVTKNHTLRAAFKSGPGGSPSNPGVPPVNPPTPPTSPDVPPVNPPAPADIPVSAGQWTVFWGTRDAQGKYGVTIQVPIKSEVPLIEGSIRVEALGIEEIGVKLLPDGRAASAHAMAQQRSYLLQITGRVAENALNTARIDALHYRLEGGGEEKTVHLGTNGGGILLKDMKKGGGETPKSNSGSGCDAGLGSVALLALVPLYIRRRR